MKFKVGDRVKLARTDSEWDWYKNYLGKIFTIKEIGKDWRNEEFAELEEDELMPFLKNLDLVKPEYTYEDLKKALIGTKVTFESGNCIIKTDENNFNGGQYYREINDLINLKDKYDILGKIIKIEEPEYKTVYEHKEEILDEAEKRYLKGIIRPFKEKVTYISKLHTREDKEFISINLKNGDYIDLPLFKENTMYKKMIINKDYTLKELGL